MTYLFDTCVLSKLRKIDRHPDEDLTNWIAQHDEEKYFLSAITIGEIQKGITLSKTAAQQRILNDWLWNELIPRFQERILELDQKVMSKWGEMYGIYQKRGILFPVIDSMIAATALTNDLILVTENTKDFHRIEELKLFNPWTDSIVASRA